MYAKCMLTLANSLERLKALKWSFSQTKQTKLVSGFCFSDNALNYSSKQTLFLTFFSIDFHWQIKISQKWASERPFEVCLLSRNMCSNNFSGSEKPMQHVGPEIGQNVTSDMWTCVILNELLMILIQFVQYIDFTLLTWRLCGDLYFAMNCNWLNLVFTLGNKKTKWELKYKQKTFKLCNSFGSG